MESTAWTIAVESPICTTAVLFAQNQKGMGQWNEILFLWLPIGFLFWWLLLRPLFGSQQQERRARESALKTLKKNDRVITIGGIYGVVTNVHQELDEVTLKVDDAANVKIRVTRGSIGRVLVDRPTEDTSSK